MNSFPSYLKNLLLLLVLLALVNVGCVTPSHYAVSGGDGDLSMAVDGGADAHAGHQHVSGKGEAAKWIFVGFLIALVVTIDLLILPATSHDPFPCCRAVVSICH